MNKKIVVVTLLFISFSTVAFAQNSSSNEVNSVSDTLKRPTNKVQISKRYNTNSSSNTLENVSPIAIPANTVDISKRANGNVVSESSNEAFPKPATKINEASVIISAKYIPNPSLSVLDNLLEMMELKNNINDASNSATLKSTAEYAELVSNITLYRSNFDNQITSQGFENCSAREQNYYLSFLKDEDRMEEYNLCLSKIN